MSLLQGHAGGARLIDTTDVSLAERLAFEHLVADLSVTFANLPSDRVMEETEHALLRLIEFLDFDRSSLGELPPNGEQFEVLCSASRNGVEPTPRGPAPPLPWYFGELRAGRAVAFSTPADLPAEALAVAEYCRRAGVRSNLGKR